MKKYEFMLHAAMFDQKLLSKTCTVIVVTLLYGCQISVLSALLLNFIKCKLKRSNADSFHHHLAEPEAVSKHSVSLWIGYSEYIILYQLPGLLFVVFSLEGSNSTLRLATFSMSIKYLSHWKGKQFSCICWLYVNFDYDFELNFYEEKYADQFSAIDTLCHIK